MVNPLLGWDNFIAKVYERPITGIQRLGKALWLELEEKDGWYIHLNSTGWLMPGNKEAASKTEVNPIYENFLHGISEKSIRIRLWFDDGQVWNWHDARMWGEWDIRQGKVMRDDPYFAAYGPDWLDQQEEAKQALRELKARKRTKDVLCDQGITAGLGNYLACEICHRAKVHPFREWNSLTEDEKEEICKKTSKMLTDSIGSTNHDHWMVFKRAGYSCFQCGELIDYQKDGKDGKGSRGSYYCPSCQILS